MFFWKIRKQPNLPK